MEWVLCFEIPMLTLMQKNADCFFLPCAQRLYDLYHAVLNRCFYFFLLFPNEYVTSTWIEWVTAKKIEANKNRLFLHWTIWYTLPLCMSWYWQSYNDCLHCHGLCCVYFLPFICVCDDFLLIYLEIHWKYFIYVFSMKSFRFEIILYRWFEEAEREREREKHTETDELKGLLGYEENEVTNVI